MSAFIVDQYHIDQLVSTGLRGCEGNNRSRHDGPLSWYHDNPTQQGVLDYSTQDRVGQMLWTENFASVQYRYPNDTPDNLPGPVGITPAYATFYTYTQPRRQLTAVEAFNVIACYEYQSCEHPGWEASEAHAYCRALERAIIHTLPGWSDAPWGITADFDTQAPTRAETRTVFVRCNDLERENAQLREMVALLKEQNALITAPRKGARTH